MLGPTVFPAVPKHQTLRHTIPIIIVPRGRGNSEGFLPWAMLKGECEPANRCGEPDCR
jgi:hypothetical protein